MNVYSSGTSCPYHTAIKHEDKCLYVLSFAASSGICDIRFDLPIQLFPLFQIFEIYLNIVALFTTGENQKHRDFVKPE